MPKVKLRDNESQQQLFRRFRKVVSSSGKLTTLRKKRWFVSRVEERRIDKKKAIRRMQRKGTKGVRPGKRTASASKDNKRGGRR